MVKQNKSNPKFIAFTGPGCSGKSTLIKSLDFNKLLKSEVHNIDSHTRSLKGRGYPINSEGSDDTQIMITLGHYMNIKNDIGMDCIFDRCVLDGFIYTKWLNRLDQVSLYVKNFAEGIYTNNIKRYDHIFYCVPDFKYVTDLDRKVKKVDNEMIKSLYDNEIRVLENLLYLHHGKNVVTTLTGSNEERKKIVEKQLKKI
tara:strand:- start:9085 stop:9681 length:597 start_codon:yes stop_codon:yes gene_type:complete